MKKVNLRDLYPDVYKNDYFVEVTACKEKVKPQMGLAARKFGRRWGERSAAQISHHKVPA